MNSDRENVKQLVDKQYEHGFYTDIEADTIPPGLDNDVIRHISAKKSEP